MKPGDHPEFFQRPPPPGRSRESTIVLDESGRFWHDEALVEHEGMADAFARWIRRHPDNNRYVLSNGYDWCYFRVLTTPFFVKAIQKRGEDLLLQLFDGNEELLMPKTLWATPAGQIGCSVKAGEYESTFSRQAQLQLQPFLGGEGEPLLVLGGQAYGFADSPL